MINRPVFIKLGAFCYVGTLKSPQKLGLKASDGGDADLCLVSQIFATPHSPRVFNGINVLGTMPLSHKLLHSFSKLYILATLSCLLTCFMYHVSMLWSDENCLFFKVQIKIIDRS